MIAFILAVGAGLIALLPSGRGWYDFISDTGVFGRAIDEVVEPIGAFPVSMPAPRLSMAQPVTPDDSQRTQPDI